MLKKILLSFAYLGISFLLFIACKGTVNNTENYVAIYKKDTAYLSLTMYDESYFGKLRIQSPGGKIEKGSIQGVVQSDTLLGDYLYKPYRAKHEKRRAFVLKREGLSLLQGSGLEHVFMGIPYYDPHSLTFDSAKFVFHIAN